VKINPCNVPPSEFILYNTEMIFIKQFNMFNGPTPTEQGVPLNMGIEMRLESRL